MLAKSLLTLVVSLLAGTVLPVRAAERLVLGEMISNTGCIACPPADQYLDELGADHILDRAVVTYHSWWPDVSDPFYQANTVENAGRINYYGADYNPHLRFDGIADGGIEGSTWASLLASRAAASAPLTVEMAVSYDPGTRAGTVAATVTSTGGVAQSGNFRMAIAESDIHWTAPNGMTVHNFTMRDMVPDHAGTPLSLGAGPSTVVSQPFNLSPAWIESDCQIVVWFQKTSTREVLQAARIFFPVDQPFLVLGERSATPAPGGDGDAHIDPGENGRLVVTLNNANPVEGAGITAALSTTDPFITILDGTSSFGTIAPLGAGSNPGDPFRFAVAAGAPSGYEPAFNLVVDYGPAPGDTREFAFTVGVGSPGDYIGPAGGYYAYENSDAGYSETPIFNWVEIDSALGGPGRWILKQDDGVVAFPLGFGFRYFGVTYDSLTVSSNGWIALGTRLVPLGDPSPSPIPDADGPAAMIAGMWSDLDPSPTGGGHVFRHFDPVQHRTIVEFSRVHHHRYFGGALPETFQFIVLDPAFHPTSNGDGEIIVQYLEVSDATRVAAGLENPAETVGIAYSWFGHENPAAVEIADGLAVKYTPDAPLGTGVAGNNTGSLSVPLLEVAPNPFATSTRIAFHLARREGAAVEVFGVDGRAVRSLFRGVAGAGTVSVEWDRLDAAKRPVPSGLYFVRVTAGGATRLAKLVVTK